MIAWHNLINRVLKLHVHMYYIVERSKYLMLSSSDTAKSLEAQLIRLNLLRQWRMKVFGGKVAAQN